MLLKLYAFLTTCASPIFRLMLWVRSRQGLEDKTRLCERFGIPTSTRQEGSLIWVHSSGMGEARMALILLGALAKRFPEVNFLWTTFELSPGIFFEDQLPERTIHQTLAWDTPSWAKRFLDAWRPNMGIFIESDLWPNLLTQAAKRDVKLALVYGIISKESFEKGWMRFPGLFGPTVRAFDVISTYDPDFEERYKEMGAKCVVSAPNLKSALPPLLSDKTVFRKMQKALGKHVWVGGSVHVHEIETLLQAHTDILKQYSDAKVVIVIRHAQDLPKFTAAADRVGLTWETRSKDELPSGCVDVFFVATMGELGLFYPLGRIAFIGATLPGKTKWIGGHNPVEAVQLGVPVMMGPEIENVKTIFEGFEKAGVGFCVETSEDITAIVSRCFDNDSFVCDEIKSTQRALLENIEKNLDVVLKQIYIIV